MLNAPPSGDRHRHRALHRSDGSSPIRLPITGVAQAVLKGRQADGSLPHPRRTAWWSARALIGQTFADRSLLSRVVPPRPVAPDPKDATKTIDGALQCGRTPPDRTYGPTSQKLIDRVKADGGKVRWEAAPPSPCPPDMPSRPAASGLDPDIIAGAYAMLPGRRASPRCPKPAGRARWSIPDHATTPVEGRTLGLFGEPHTECAAN